MVISNTDSMVSSNQTDVTSEASVRNLKSSTMSVPRIGKTLGTLALLLSGGQAEASTTFNPGRRLLDGGAHTDESLIPYHYDSLCHDGIIQAHIDGLTKEGCLDKEQEKIDAISAGKPLGLLKNCYTISGYLSAALTGAGLVGGVSGSPVVMSSALCSALVGLIPTAVCGGVSNTIKGRLHDSRKVAEQCCKYFVSEENTANNTTSTFNSTATPNR